MTRKLPALRASGGYVSISAYGDDLASLRTQLVSKGLKDATQHSTAVSGRAPVAALRDMAATPGLKFLRPTLAMTRAGTVRTQGDRSLRADLARARKRRQRARRAHRRAVRQLQLPHRRLRARRAVHARRRRTSPATICRATSWCSRTSPDAPSDDCSDEGRAMMQLIHDVAPGSPLAFYTAFESQEDFAAGIRALADAGSKVIVDDVIYFAEPMFEDGIIAQAVDDVHRDGVAYFSSAGNEARQSYESRFRRSGEAGHLGPAPRLRSRRSEVDGLQSATASAGSRHAAVRSSGISRRSRPTASAARQRRRHLVLRRRRRSDRDLHATIPSSSCARSPASTPT